MDPALVYGSALAVRYAMEGHEAVLDAVGEEAATILGKLKDRVATLVGDRIWTTLSRSPTSGADEVSVAVDQIARTDPARLEEFRSLLEEYERAVPVSAPSEYRPIIGDNVGSAQFGSSLTVGGDIVGRDKTTKGHH